MTAGMTADITTMKTAAEFLTSFNVQSWDAFTQLTLCHYLIFSLLIFAIGLAITVSSGNLVKMAAGFGIMLNALCINFTAANAFMTAENNALSTVSPVVNSVVSNFAPKQELFYTFNLPEGQVISLFLILFGLTGALTALALVLAVYFRTKGVNICELNNLKSPDCPDYDNCNNSSYKKFKETDEISEDEI